jgi:hypothetical protein
MVDRLLGELNKGLIPLTVNNVLVPAKTPQNIFKMLELALEAEEARPPWVVQEGATSRGGEV